MVATIRFDTRMLQRYAALEPRHRLYPEVSILHDGFGERQHRVHLQRSNAALIPRPIGLYVHVPEGVGSGERYAEQLLREIELLAPLLDRDREVARLHFGGAVDRLAPDIAAGLVDSIARRFHLTPATLRDGRIDLGDLNDATKRLTAYRAPGVPEAQVSVAFGLIRQSPDAFAAKLCELLDAGPPGVALIDGALVTHPRRREPAQDAEVRLRTFELGIQHLVEGGYRHLGGGRFLREDREPPPADYDWVGFGPGAVSRLGDGISENGKDVRRWQAALDAGRLPVARGVQLGPDERIRIDVLRQLLGPGSVDKKAIEKRHNAAFDEYYAPVLESLRGLETDGLLRLEKDRLVATSCGRYLWRILADSFPIGRQRSQRVADQAEYRIAKDQRGESSQ